MGMFTVSERSDAELRRYRTLAIVPAVVWLGLGLWRIFADGPLEIWLFVASLMMLVGAITLFVPANNELRLRRAARNERAPQVWRVREEVGEEVRDSEVLEDPGHPDADRTR